MIYFSNNYKNLNHQQVDRIIRITRIFLVALFISSVMQAHSGSLNPGVPSLVKAINSRDYNQVKRLLKSDDSLISDFNGSPILLFSINPKCDARILKLLLESGADPNRRELGTATTPMLEALAQGNLICINLLIKHGGNIGVVDSNGAGPLYKSVTSGNLDVLVRMFEMEVDINEIRSDGTTPLMYAAQAGYISIVEYLLKQGAEECLRNSRGLSARDFAMLTEDKRTVGLFTKSCGGGSPAPPS